MVQRLQSSRAPIYTTKEEVITSKQLTLAS